MVKAVSIIGEDKDGIRVIRPLLRSLGYTHVYAYDHPGSSTQIPGKMVAPDTILINMDLFKDATLSGYVEELYPGIPVVALCEQDEMLYALEAVGNKVDYYITRDQLCTVRIAKALNIADSRHTDPEMYCRHVKWLHTLIPEAIMDVANVLFFVDYEDPDSQVNSKIRNAVIQVLTAVDDKIGAAATNMALQ
jgi:hypothetical protein